MNTGSIATPDVQAADGTSRIQMTPERTHIDAGTEDWVRFERLKAVEISILGCGTPVLDMENGRIEYSESDGGFQLLNSVRQLAVLRCAKCG